MGRKKLAEIQRREETEIVEEMSEDEAAINDFPDNNDLDSVPIPACSTAFVDSISLTFSKQITTDQETNAPVDKLMLIDLCNGCCCVEGWSCMNQLFYNTDFHNLKKQNQFKIHFKPNLVATFQGATTQVLCSPLGGKMIKDTLGQVEGAPSEALAVLVLFSAVILTSFFAF